jgi:hypothetical protein
MAKRSRSNRKEIPGYDDSRPSRDERKKQHRQVRHAAHQMLHMVDDPEEVIGLPEIRRTRQHEVIPPESATGKSRFKLWKTKFWKRRDAYREVKSELDANWPVITSEQLRHDET